MTRLRVLRALARFDTAGAHEIAAALGLTRDAARHHLGKLVDAGHATRLGDNHIRYSVTEAGRLAARSAA